MTTYNDDTWTPELDPNRIPELYKSLFGYNAETGEYDLTTPGNLLRPAENMFSPEIMQGLYQQGLQTTRAANQQFNQGQATSSAARGVTGPDLGAIYNAQQMAKMRGDLAQGNLAALKAGTELGVTDYANRMAAANNFMSQGGQWDQLVADLMTKGYGPVNIGGAPITTTIPGMDWSGFSGIAETRIDPILQQLLGGTLSTEEGRNQLQAVVDYLISGNQNPFGVTGAPGEELTGAGNALVEQLMGLAAQQNLPPHDISTAGANLLQQFLQPSFKETTQQTPFHQWLAQTLGWQEGQPMPNMTADQLQKYYELYTGENQFWATLNQNQQQFLANMGYQYWSQNDKTELEKWLQTKRGQDTMDVTMAQNDAETFRLSMQIDANRKNLDTQIKAQKEANNVNQLYTTFTMQQATFNQELERIYTSIENPAGNWTRGIYATYFAKLIDGMKAAYDAWAELSGTTQSFADAHPEAAGLVGKEPDQYAQWADEFSTWWDNYAASRRAKGDVRDYNG